MPPLKPPPHGLIIKYGKLEAAAYGRMAVLGLITLVAIAGVIAARVFGFL